ncbi:MAG: RluA family pseudouridine synthase [Sulfurospirillaceae bacterium]|nr:RluA family pseudouridine synthase [Sulfurospirillaceae bacterium]
MAYVSKTYFLSKPKKAFRFLMDELNVSMNEAQSIIDRRRVSIGGNLLTCKSCDIQGEISVLSYEPKPRGLEPIFETEDFAVFEKPSGIMIHPKKREDAYTLNDEIKSRYGKDANCAHRIDKGTSGLVLVGKNKQSEIALKSLFANRQVRKTYLALVEGKIEKAMMIDEKLKRDLPQSKVRIKVHVDESGKNSQTKITPLEYFDDIDATLIEAEPLTGRQHQIRVHLFHVKHKIIGDIIYGVDEDSVVLFLDNKLDKNQTAQLSGCSRLLLHAHSLQFSYKGVDYEVVSKTDIKTLFYNLAKGL